MHRCPALNSSTCSLSSPPLIYCLPPSYLPRPVPFSAWVPLHCLSCGFQGRQQLAHQSGYCKLSEGMDELICVRERVCPEACICEVVICVAVFLMAAKEAVKDGRL